MTFTVEIAKRPEDAKLASKGADKGHEDELGIRVTDLTPELSQRMNLTPAEGVLVEVLSPTAMGRRPGFRPAM